VTALFHVQVKYRDGLGSETVVMETVDMERVRRNQENISLVRG
jgi:hypothetical protein